MRAGEEFAGHRIETELGRGGMGVVYRAHHLALDRERALKVITPELSADERFRARFEREARLAAQVEHPNVISVHHAGDEEGQLYLSMRLVDGLDCAELVDREGPLALPRAARIVSAVAAGLDAAHDRGLVHRDVKPSNILIEDAGGTDLVFITDFGISTSFEGDSPLTVSGEFLGSPDYAAPEHISDEAVDRRADIYSLGAVAYFVLTGEPPFAGRSAPARLVAHASADRPQVSDARPEVGEDLDAIIARAMAIAPSDRYRSAGEFARELRRAVPRTGETGEAQTQRMRTLKRRPRLSRRAGAALGTLLAAVVAALIILATSGREGTETIGVGQSPNGVAVGESTLWVAAHEDGTVWGIDPSDTGAEAQILPLDSGTPRAIAVGFGSLWVVEPRVGEVVRLDPGQEGVTSTPIDVGEEPGDVAVGEQRLWVTNEGDGTVSRIDPAHNTVDRIVQTGGSPRAIATGVGNAPGGIWVADPEAGVVRQINGADAAVEGEPIQAGRRPSDLVVAAGGVWVTDSLGDGVRRIDIDTREVGPPIPVGTEPLGIAFGFGSIWVANSADDTVTRIDPGSARVEDRAIPVGDDPGDLAAGFGSIWTTNFGDDTVTRLEP